MPVETFDLFLARIGASKLYPDDVANGLTAAAGWLIEKNNDEGLTIHGVEVLDGKLLIRYQDGL